MSPQPRWLPLFPLNTVLFPNASLPLQIFEERYKLMMRHCLNGEPEFGVVLIKSGSEVGEPAIPYSTGTVAHIVQQNQAADGLMFISVTGRQRFQLGNITQYRPYMAAEVSLLEEDVEDPLPAAEMEALGRAVAKYSRLMIGLRGGWMRDFRTSSDPAALSYFIAGLLQVGLQEKQALLEEPSASKRLAKELDLLMRETEPLKQRVAYELRRNFSRQ